MFAILLLVLTSLLRPGKGVGRGTPHGGSGGGSKGKSSSGKSRGGGGSGRKSARDAKSFPGMTRKQTDAAFAAHAVKSPAQKAANRKAIKDAYAKTGSARRKAVDKLLKGR